MTKKRARTDTTLSPAPFTVDEALAAMLHTPPPPAEKNAPKQKPTKKAKKR